MCYWFLTSRPHAICTSMSSSLHHVFFPTSHSLFLAHFSKKTTHTLSLSPNRPEIDERLSDLGAPRRRSLPASVIPYGIGCRLWQQPCSDCRSDNRHIIISSPASLFILLSPSRPSIHPSSFSHASPSPVPIRHTTPYFRLFIQSGLSKNLGKLQRFTSFYCRLLIIKIATFLNENSLA